MAKLMIYDRDDVSSINDLKESYKKGYVVDVFEDDSNRCSYVSPFVSLTILEKSVEEMKNKYLSIWEMEIDFNVVSYDEDLDKWRLAMRVTNPGVSNVGAATQSTIDKATMFINKWGGTNTSIVGDALEFDISCYSAITSGVFWKCNPDLIDFNEIGYDKISGIHILTADYSGLLTYQLGPTCDYNAAMNNVLSGKMTMLKKDGNKITFYVNREDVVECFKNDIRRLSEDVVCLRRYCFTSEGVDVIISAGRQITVNTEDEISDFIVDKMAQESFD